MRIRIAQRESLNCAVEVFLGLLELPPPQMPESQSIVASTIARIAT